MKYAKKYAYYPRLFLLCSSMLLTTATYAGPDPAVLQELKKLDTHGEGLSDGKSKLYELTEEKADLSHEKMDGTNDRLDVTNDQLDNIRQIVGDHYKLVDEDYRQKEVAAAIINYWADWALKDYEFKKDLLFMPAPATEVAISTGKKVDESDHQERADEMIKRIFDSSMSAFLATEEELRDYSKFSSAKLRLYKAMMEKIDNDITRLPELELGGIIGKDRVDADTAEEYVTYLTNPFQTIDVEISKRVIEGKELTLRQQERIAERIIDSMSMAPSLVALGELFGRRMAEEDDPETDDDEKKETVMEIMRNYTDLRLLTDDWYALISKSSDTALLRELIHIMAYQTWQQQQSFRLKEQEVALLAVMNANYTRMYSTMNKLYDEFALMNAEARARAWEAERRIRQLDIDTEGTPPPDSDVDLGIE